MNQRWISFQDLRICQSNKNYVINIIYLYYFQYILLKLIVIVYLMDIKYILILTIDVKKTLKNYRKKSQF